MEPAAQLVPPSHGIAAHGACIRVRVRLRVRVRVRVYEDEMMRGFR